MDINTNSLASMRKGFTSLFDEGLNSAKPQWNAVAMEVPSTTKSNNYGWLANSTAIREWVGDRVVKKIAEAGFEIQNKDWEQTQGVDRNDIQDDNLGVYAPLMKLMGFNAAMHPDELVFSLLKGGFTKNGYDGQYFFDTDHPVINADGSVSSVSNTGGGSGNAWFLLDTSKPIKPIIFQNRKKFSFQSFTDENDHHVFMKKEFLYGGDGRYNVGYGLWQLAYGSKQTLDATAYAAARTAMLSMKGDNGKPINVSPTLLVVGPSNEKAALDLIQAERLANGATNTYRNTATVLVSPYLD